MLILVCILILFLLNWFGMLKEAMQLDVDMAMFSVVSTQLSSWIQQ